MYVTAAFFTTKNSWRPVTNLRLVPAFFMQKTRKEKLQMTRIKKPKPLVLSFALPEADHQRLRDLGARFELNESAVARKALKLGMDKIDEAGAIFPRGEK
jgi:hypothetical protein